MSNNPSKMIPGYAAAGKAPCRLRYGALLAAGAAAILASTSMGRGEEGKIMTTSQFAPSVILAEQPVAGILGTTNNWVASTTHVRYLTSGKWPVEAEAELAIDASPDGFDDSLFPCKFPNAPHYKRGNISLEACRGELGDFNRISLMVYPDMPDRAALWIEAPGAPTWTAATFPLLPRQWNKIYLDLGHLKPEGRRAIKSLMLGSTALGLLPGDAPLNRYYLKDLTLEQVLPRNVAGWEISPRYVGISQVGFAPWQDGKRALFSGQMADSTFRVRRAEDDGVAFSGQLIAISNELGRFKLADFTAMKTAGEYYLEAGDTRSVVFPISERPFRGAVSKCLEFLSCMRSGCRTAAHPNCFRDDAIREDNREPVDLSGGWFDASDLRLYNSMSMTSILRPLAVVADSARGDRPLSRALREEMLWGARFLGKIWDEETGLPFTMLYVHAPRTERFKKVPYFKNNNYWTDNRRGTADDRVMHTPWKAEYIDGALNNFAHHLGICAAGAHYLAATPERTGTRLNREILEHVERHFQRIRDDQFVKENQRIFPGSHLMRATASLSLTVETAARLAEVTGKSLYGEMAVHAADHLLRRQQRTLIDTGTDNGIITGYFDSPAPYRPSLISQPVGPVDALIRLLESGCAATNYFKYYAALKVHADLFVKKCYQQDEPYPLLPTIIQQKTAQSRFLGKALNAKGEEFYLAPPSYQIYSVAIESYNLIRLGAFLGDRELQTIGINLLQWQLGRNPSSFSLIAEVGGDYKPDMMSTTLGHMPGMMIIGIGSKDGAPHFPQHNGHNEIYTQETPYLQAMAQANAECRLGGRITRDGKAARRVRLTLRNDDFGKEYSVRTNRRGEFDDLLLPGGLDFDVTCDGMALGRFTSLAGLSKRMEWELAGGCTLRSASTPGRTAGGSELTAEVELFAWGQPPPVRIEAHGHSVTPLEAERTVEPAPGVSKVAFKFKAADQNIPYVVMFNRQGNLQNIASAAGAVTARANDRASE